MKHANISIFVPHVGCPNMCSFCNQHSISSSINVPTVNDVRETLKNALSNINSEFEEKQIAFFGGSFTAMDRNLMLELLKVANEFLGEDKFSSIRISTRPDAIDEEVLDILKRYGVKSIELGAQSMNDKTLKLNRRGHTSQDVVLASNLIKEKGFELGLQMMPGLFGDSEEDVFETAKKLADLKPTTMRIYPTVVLKNTYLAELFEKGEYTPLSLEDAVDISSKLLQFFESKNIKVIKLGLHASETLSSGYLAGPYHPAFRELCESRVFLNKLIMQLNSYPNGSYEVLVNPKFISKALGQKQENVFKLKQLGYNICFKQDNNINSDSFIIRKG